MAANNLARLKHQSAFQIDLHLFVLSFGASAFHYL